MITKTKVVYKCLNKIDIINYILILILAFFACSKINYFNVSRMNAT